MLLSFSDSGLGDSVCDRLQCVYDRTTAECMAASHFNHSVTSQCSGPRPPCMRRPRPPTQPTDADSSEESYETKSDLQTHGHTKPAGIAREQEGKDTGKPETEEDKKEVKEEEEEKEEGGGEDEEN